ncbi:alpha/beta hydrolase [Nocardioides terrisoli]|uniref:alpha/beta hydrolase n=1 Tax=Nocardioides terrisoli TaxID=3388267 RepID=UPI00287BB152|nr:alpha/beta hydrolase [Nocardioides marmorisolisilvae]
MKRLIIVGMAGALGLSLAGTSAGQAAPAPTGLDAVAVASSTAPSVHWGSCPTGSYDYASYGIQCGTLRVPLDYRHPHGRQITLEVSRRKHDPKAGPSKGIILINPGGPGGSGLIMPYLQQYVPHSVGMRYDWIGFDPRGVGASRPALHCNRELFGTDRPYYVPNRKRTKYWLGITKRYAHDCATSKASRLLPHMTTADNARDMDRIRAALGQSKMSYYGFSWGTYLGAAYAKLFPHRVKRMILDGVVNPNRVWYGANLDQDRAFDRNMDVYWRYLAKHDDSFHLGTDWKTIKTGYYAEVQKLRGHPRAGGRLGPDELGDAMLDAGYYVYDWVDIGNAYSALINKGEGRALFKMYKSSSMGADAENGYAVYDAVQCTDNPWPGWKKTRSDSWRVYQKAPFLTWGNTWYNAPCLHWGVPAQHRLHMSGKRLKHHVLMISETKDAATPFSGALELRKLFPTASLIAGRNGTTHAGSLSGVACVDNKIARYLANGSVPRRVAGNRADVYCPHVPAPQPTSTSTSGRRMLDLRAVLMRAQQSMLR